MSGITLTAVRFTSIGSSSWFPGTRKMHGGPPGPPESLRMSGESTLTNQAAVEVLLECSIDLSQIPETYLL